ncbi:MAG: S41 family peptidase [Flavobacteriales bacterium]
MTQRPHLLLATLALFGGLQAQQADRWLRQPAISPDGNTIAFCYQGDIWRVPTGGGEATVLTINDAYDHTPVWSPDGKQIAFASTRHGNNDVFVMPSSGGPATRLTYHSSSETPSGFSPDGANVLFYGHRQDDVRHQQFPVGGLGELYSVPAKGGRPVQVSTIAMQSARYNAAGNVIVYHDRKGYEDNYRKHHTSSVTRDIWTFDPKTKAYKQLTTFAGEDRDPVFNLDGSTIYYLTEEKGSYNVHKMPSTGGASTQVSFLKDHPVRSLSMSNTGTLCFTYRGDIHSLTDGGTPVKVEISTHSDGRYLPERTVKVNDDISEVMPSPNGKEMAFIHRGEVFVSSLEGTTRRVTNTPEQERSVSWSPDGRTLLYATERGGSWDLYITSIVRKEEPYFFNATLLKEEALLATPAEEFQATYSPDGKEVAYLEERTTLKALNIATKQTRTVLPAVRNYSYADGDQWYSWSPDSKWFLVEFLNKEQWINQVGIINADGKQDVIDLTRSGYGGYHPEWSADGSAVYFYSSRDGMKNHASWGGQSNVYALFLTRQAYDRYKLNKEELELVKEAEKKTEETEKGEKDKKDEKGKKEEKSDKKEEVKPVKIEMDGLYDRKVRLTVHSSNLSAAVLSKDAEKLYYLTPFEKGFDLWQTELRTRETKIISKLGAGWAGDLKIDKEGKNLYFINNGSISRYDIEKSEMKGVSVNGEMTLNENAERAYLFEHVWRQVKKKFYRVDLQGVDWDLYKKEYQRFVPDINNNYDMAELLSEMLGELNASHTGAGYRHSEPTDDQTAALGLLYAPHDGPGLLVAELLPRSPVLKEGSKVRPGIVIEQIDGQALTPDIDPARLLNRKAGKPTLLALHDPKTNTRWEEIVKPIGLGAETDLLYQRWVERSRHIVDSLSKGQLGYVHVEGMDDQSFRVVYEEALGRYHDRKGLVVDTRFNGGGWLHDDLATFLNGKTYMRFEPRGQRLGTEPQFKWQRPSVVVMSEGNYSDAHMFPVTYRALGIGKLVGMPVAGTGTAVWWEGLQNGMWFGIPQVGMIDNNGNYLENQQLDPDVKQALEPGAVSTGRDQQLEEAVKVLLGQ